MASSQPDDSTKSFDATPHKLNAARKKGEIARSADLNTAAGYAGFLTAALLGGAASIDLFGNTMMVILDQAGPIADLVFSGSASSQITGVLQVTLLSLAVWFLMPFSFVLLSALTQRSIIFAPTKLKPKLSRISLAQNAKNKYGPSGLFEFGKSFVKLSLFSILLVTYLFIWIPRMAGSLHASPPIIGNMIVQFLVQFLWIVVIASAVLGMIDYAWQYFDHLRRNRMSHQEIKDENKEQEGDPALKQERRQRASRIASEQITSAVPTADVVIVNPVHYAVALKWSREVGSAPECVAKGVDHMAFAIKETALKNGVPVRSDPPTARALFASTEVGQEIDPKHYRAVAAAIRFAEAVRQRAAYWSRG